MILWIDAQLSPYLAAWLAAHFAVKAYPVRGLGLRDATDRQICRAARDAGAVVMTKDSDFLELLDRLGPPPQVLWITCGNTSNERLRTLLQRALPPTLQRLEAGEPLVEISDAT